MVGRLAGSFTMYTFRPFILLILFHFSVALADNRYLHPQDLFELWEVSATARLACLVTNEAVEIVRLSESPPAAGQKVKVLNAVRIIRRLSSRLKKIGMVLKPGQPSLSGDARRSLRRSLRRKRSKFRRAVRLCEAFLEQRRNERGRSSSSSSSSSSLTSEISDSAECGDNLITGSEQCECGADGVCGTDDDHFLSDTCASRGFSTGQLRCKPGCAGFDESGCLLMEDRIYADAQLQSDCTEGNYSVFNRSCSGSDGTGYRTIQAAANRASAGTTVLIRSGLYNERVQINVSGTSSSRIVFRNFNGEAPIIDGTGLLISGSNGLVYIDANDYITFDGLIVRNSPGAGLVAYRSNHLELRNCIIHGAASAGVYLRGASYSLIDHCDVYGNTLGVETRYHDTSQTTAQYNLIRNSLFHENTLNPEEADGISISTGSLHNRVSNNVLYNNYDDGIDASTGGVYLPPELYHLSSIDTTIEGNVIFAIGDGPAGAGDGNGIKVSTNNGGDNKVFYNVVIQSERACFDEDPKSDEPIGNQVYNNLCVQNRWGLVIDHRATTLYGMYPALRNNIVYDNNDPERDLYLRNFPPLGGPAMNAGHFSNNFFNSLLFSGSSLNPAFVWGDDPYNLGDGSARSLSGVPGLIDPYGSLRADFPVNWSISQKVNYIHYQARSMFGLSDVSELIDKGALIPGLHCARADDDPLLPMDRYASCRHWLGQAPDIGPYEKR